MPLPRKGILIRIVIYGTLLSFFGWRAYDRHREEKAAEAAAASPSGKAGPQTREYRLPDGRSVEVLEVTPEQAEAMFGVPQRVAPGDAAAEPDGGGAEAKAAAPADAGEAAASADAGEAGAPAVEAAGEGAGEAAAGAN